jgi:hypothetical protein
MLTLRQRAAKVIRSLLTESRFSDHIINPGKGPETIVASEVVTQLESETTLNGLNDGDAALAIGEHAFRAGFQHAVRIAQNLQHPEQFEDVAWSEYEPSEDVKALS